MGFTFQGAEVGGCSGGAALELDAFSLGSSGGAALELDDFGIGLAFGTIICLAFGNMTCSI